MVRTPSTSPVLLSRCRQRRRRMNVFFDFSNEDNGGDGDDANNLDYSAFRRTLVYFLKNLVQI
jgi:hypothetical protein